MGLRAVLSIGVSSGKSRLILRLAKLGVSAARGSLVACSSGRPGCLPTGGRTTTSWEGSELMIGGPGPFDSLPPSQCGGLRTRGPSLGAPMGGCRRAYSRRIFPFRSLSLSPSFPLRFSEDSYTKIVKSDKEGWPRSWFLGNRASGT